MEKQSSLRLLNRILWAVFVVALVVVASYVSLGRYLVRYVETYQAQLVQQLVEATGLPLTVARVHGRWSKLSPIITLDSVNLDQGAGDGDSVMSMRKLQVQLDPLASLLSRSPQLQSLQLDFAQFVLQEVEGGQWQLAGYPGQEQETNPDRFIDLLLTIRRISAVEVKFLLRYADGQESLMTAKSVQMERDGSFRRLRLKAGFNDSAQLLDIILEGVGDPRDGEEFAASGYIKLDDIDFADQIPAIKRLGLNLNYAHLDGQAWLTWRPGRMITAQGIIRTPSIDLAGITGKAIPALDDVQVAFHADSEGIDRWRLWLPSIRGRWGKNELVLDRSTAVLTPAKLSLAMPALDVEPLIHQLLAFDLLPATAVEPLSGLAPSGILRDIHLDIDRSAQSTERFSLVAMADRLNVEPWHGAPGAAGVSGYLEVGPLRGRIDLISQSFSLSFPGLFPAPLDFSEIATQLRWQVAEQRLLITSNAMKLQTDHGAAAARLALDIPLHKDIGTPLMNLEVGLIDADAGVRERYLPEVLGEPLLAWLKRSIVAGHVASGGFIYRGSLLKEDHDNRSTQLFFDVDNATLDYQESWPPLTALAALVVIDDARVDVVSQRGQLLNFDVGHARVNVEPGAGNHLQLTVDASATGPAESGLRLVRESPIRQAIGDTFDNWSMAGSVAVDVKLKLPLVKEGGHQDIQVGVQFDNADLAIPDYRLQLDSIHGPLHYDSSKGLSSDGIVGQLMGQRVLAKVRQQHGQPLVIDLTGKVEMSDLADWLDQPAMTFVSGHANVRAAIRVSTEHPSEFVVSSDLRGAEIDLPAPFGKPAEQARSFKLSLPMGQAQATLDMTVADQAAMQLFFERGQLESGLLAIGSSSIATDIHEQGVFRVSGAVDHFDLPVWQPVLQRFNQARQRQSDPSQRALTIKVKDFHIGRFDGFGQHFEQLVFDASQREGGWALAADCETFDVDIDYPLDESSPFQLHFRRLNVPAAAGTGVTNLNPGELPAVKVRIDQLSFDGKPYGALAFDLTPVVDGAIFDHIEADIKGLQLLAADPGRLIWQKNGAGQSTQIHFPLVFGDIGDLLEGWDYERIVESKKGHLNLDLTWPDSPDQWTLATLNGDVGANLQQGRFLKASAGSSGALKVVGILNFTNLVRRLQLDFKDLYRSGISYDEVKGHFRFDSGELAIIDQLSIKSPSSAFFITGKSDLIQQQLDMELVATMPVANNLPLIVAAMGNLPGAVATYVAGKIFKKQLDSFSSLVYALKGGWDNPELEFIKIFDDTLPAPKMDKSSASGPGHLMPKE